MVWVVRSYRSCPLLSDGLQKENFLMTSIVTASIGIGALTMPKVASRLIPAYGRRLSYVILGSALLAVVVVSAQFLKGGTLRCLLRAHQRRDDH